LFKVLNRFRWAFCQLEALRHCLPPSVRLTLNELPESLDETYERILKEIKKPNRNHARRLLQCLIVAIRPLQVEELAEVLAVDFDDVEGIPKLNPNWRWEDDEQALLTSCSSLIAIIETEDSRIVQFSHFSVKEFLTSTRLADSSKDVSRYQINLEPAHTILAQACTGVLLQSDDRVEENGTRACSPLAEYAAEHWITHAQFKSVSSFLRKSMEYLFDLDKPYFVAWLGLYNIDIAHNPGSSSLYWFGVRPTSSATPLYYASLCGFQDLVEHLAIKHPGHVNTSGGFYVTPLVAALAGRHFQTAKVLHHNGAHLDARGKNGGTLLHSPVLYGDLEMVQVLLDYKVDVNTQRDSGRAPLHDGSMGGIFARIRNVVQSSTNTVKLLLEHGADVNMRALDNSTPLHVAMEYGRVKIVPMLLEHGANVDAKDKNGRTPLHEAVESWSDEPVRMSLEHGADVGAKDNQGRTPLHGAAENGTVEPALMLLERGANIGVKDNKGRTPLHDAAQYGCDDVVRVLLEHGAANIGAKDVQGRTPLHIAAQYGRGEVVRVLLERGANVGAKDYEGRTPFQLASVEGREATVKLLSNYDYGAMGVVPYSIPTSTSSLCLPW
jgi:ankyrin repeat protein